jgi:serine/threonine protein kinase/Flp pilus assembly protein TadD
MNQPERQIISLLGEAVEYRSPEERAAFLDQACAGDASRRARVEELLRAYQAAGNFLQGTPPSSNADTTVDEPVRERPGTVIGSYKLLEQIGEGGMGLVFMAEQTQPVRRKVALKVLKPGMDTRQVVARFEAERQALALMDHPNIAKIHDGGTTESGRPYFVMELVRGVPITQYCDERRLSTRQRLELFVTVCQAVQHAHQKGVIHRDLKPSNVLVSHHDTVAVPKIIDFGIAKATTQPLTDRTLFTHFAQMVGTPLYMSPEQAEMNGLGVDTRTDVYALGALLYELLTGTTPFESDTLKKVGLDEMRRMIREEEPPTPSRRLSTLSARACSTISERRGAGGRRLGQVLRAELDWIVMKALEKDRNGRYETASAFAADVQRYLHDEPVQACSPSALYRCHKFAKRNKVGLVVAALVLFFVILLGGSVGWILRDRGARQKILEAEIALALKEITNSYEQDKLPDAFAAVRRAETLLASGMASDEVHQRVRQWRDDLELVAKLADIRAQPMTTVDGEFMDWASADPAYREAFRHYGLDLEVLHPDQAAGRIKASGIKERLLAALDDWVRVKWQTRLSGWEKLLDVINRADSDPWRNELHEAFRRQDLNALERLARDTQVLDQPSASLHFLTEVLTKRDRVPLAIDVWRQVQQRRPADLLVNEELAFCLWRTGDCGEAAGFYRAALVLRPQSPMMHMRLGQSLAAQGKCKAAIVEFSKAIELKPDFAWVHLQRGKAYESEGEPHKAQADYRRAVELQSGFIEHEPQRAAVWKVRGNTYAALGQWDKAAADYTNAIALKPDDWQLYYERCHAFFCSHQFDKAVEDCTRGIERNLRIWALWARRADAYAGLGQHDKARADYAKADELKAKANKR